MFCNIHPGKQLLPRQNIEFLNFCGSPDTGAHPPQAKKRKSEMEFILSEGIDGCTAIFRDFLVVHHDQK